MVQYLFTLVLATISVLPQGRFIEWKADRKLTWGDFKAPPDGASPNAALTSSTIDIEFGFDDNGLLYAIKCRFDRNRSWVKVRTPAVLAHEQGHFDIAELHARKLNKALKAYTFNRRTVNRDVNRIYDTLIAAHHEAQNLYDLETDFSRNREKQEAWSKKIAAELKVLDVYAGYTKKQSPDR